MGIDNLEQYFAKHQPDQCLAGTRWLLNELRALSPKVYVEIGCAHLATFGVYESELPKDGLAIGVDVRSYNQWDTYQSLSGCEFHLVKGDSSNPDTISKVKGLLGGRQIDFLFIDGCHDYYEVKSDWEQFSPLVRSGGFVAFHDCDIQAARQHGFNFPGARCGGQGAGMVADELQRSGRRVEFVPGTFIGTGVVRI